MAASGSSAVAAYALGGEKSLPVLVCPEAVLTDSGQIVDYAARHGGASLYPRADERAAVQALEKELVGAYGVETRRIAYEWFFRSMDASLPYNAGKAPRYQTTLVRRLAPMVRAVGSRYLEVSAKTAGRGDHAVDAMFDRVAERLSDGRRYLFGEAFTAADLAFAAMTAPVVLPPQYPVLLPQPDSIPPDARDQVRRRRVHPAGEFALRLYEERPAPRGVLDR